MKPLRRRSFGLGCESLESRDNPSGTPAVATGAAVGDAPYVTVYDRTGTQIAHFLAYDASYTGGVNVAVGNVKGDGHMDIVVAPKTGVANIRVYDGVSFQLVNSFNAFDAGFKGGASIAEATLFSDGVPDIIVGAGAGGGPNVRVFDGMTDTLIKSFYAFDPGFQGGVNVAANNYIPSQYGVTIFNIPPTFYPAIPGAIIAAAGPGGGPQVTIFDAQTLAVDQSFYAYDPSFRGGVNVAYAASGTLGTLITGAGVGGSSNLRLFTTNNISAPYIFSLTNSIYAGSSSDTGGVSVGIDASGNSIFAIANPLTAQSVTKVYDFSLKPTVFGQDTFITPNIPGITNWGHIGSFPT